MKNTKHILGKLSINTTIGSIFIVAGTAIGAGMLVLPIPMFSLGIIPSSILLVTIWWFMFTNAQIASEVICTFPKGSTFHSISLSLLGKIGWWITILAILSLFYALISAYTFAFVKFISQYTSVNYKILTPIFIIILGSLIVRKIKIVDNLNRTLFIIKLLFLLIIITKIITDTTFISIDILHPTAINFNGILPAITLLITAFGFHGSIPSVVNYSGKNTHRLNKILFIGSIIPLIIYLVWNFCTFIIIPEHIVQNIQNPSDLVSYLENHFNNKYVKISLILFAQGALLTSFLGVSLGLFDFFKDVFSSYSNEKQNILGSISTFFLPCLVVIFIPELFIKALNFAGIALTVIAVIIPNLMLLKLQKDKKINLTLLRQIISIFHITVGLSIVTLEINRLF